MLAERNTIQLELDRACNPSRIQFQGAQLHIPNSQPKPLNPPKAPMMTQATSSRLFGRDRLDPMVLRSEFGTSLVLVAGLLLEFGLWYIIWCIL